MTRDLLMSNDVWKKTSPTPEDIFVAAQDLARKGDPLAILYLIKLRAPTAMFAYSQSRRRPS